MFLLMILIREALSQSERIFPQDLARVRLKPSMQTAGEPSKGASAAVNARDLAPSHLDTRTGWSSASPKKPPSKGPCLQKGSETPSWRQRGDWGGVIQGTFLSRVLSQTQRDPKISSSQSQKMRRDRNHLATHQQTTA